MAEGNIERHGISYILKSAMNALKDLVNGTRGEVDEKVVAKCMATIEDIENGVFDKDDIITENDNAYMQEYMKKAKEAQEKAKQARMQKRAEQATKGYDRAD